jgi:NADPH-ferrihemoprotein reductase
LVIFWGSQSGTAERMASRLAKEFHQRFGLKCLSIDASDYEPCSVAEIPATKVCVFIASTFGEGDPSDNLHSFWDWIHATSDKRLSELKYMAFGLGNSYYKHYNKVIKVVVERLDTLGAQSLLPTGMADDAKGETEEHFLEWKERVIQTFRTELGYAERDPVYEPSLKVFEDESLEPIDLHHGVPSSSVVGIKGNNGMSAVYSLPVKMTKELYQDSEHRNCIHMEVDLNEYPELRYKTGDHLGVWPINPDIEVNRLLHVLGQTDRRRVPIIISSFDDDVKVKVPTPTTLDALFGHYLEICAPISRGTIILLLQFAPTTAVKDFLAPLTDKVGFANFTRSRYINLGRLLQLTSSNKGAWRGLPLSFIVESLPVMQPRYYSISSSSAIAPRTAALTVVISDTVLQDSAERIPGLSTNYLLALKTSLTLDNPKCHPRGLTYNLNGPQDSLAGGRIHAQVRKSNFRLPVSASHPIIMIAAGTGVAPFRAFLQERERMQTMGKEVGTMLLFFGCRNPDEDFIYASELEELQTRFSGRFRLVMAFSRADEGYEKAYVQHRVAEHAETICKLLVDDNANFYICGSAAMARDVSNTISRELCERLQWTEEDCRGFADKQKKFRRWQQDVWG